MNTKHIYIQLTLRQYCQRDTGNTMRTTKQANQLTEGSVLKSNEAIWSYNIPLSENRIHSDLNTTTCWGCMQWHMTRTRSVGSPGQQFLDLLDQASWCHTGMARSSWLHRYGMGCHRLWCRAILLNSWHGRNSWSLFHLGCWCCRCSRCGLHAWCRWGWCRLCH